MNTSMKFGGGCQDLWQSIGFNTSKKLTVIEKNDISYIKELIRHNVATGMCMCVSKDLIEESFPFVQGILHDNWLALVASVCSITVAYNEKLVLYRQHSNNVVAGNKSTLSRWRKNGPKYYNKVHYRLVEIQTLIKRYEITEECFKVLSVYEDYLRYRTYFLQKKVNFFSIMSRKDVYSKYEIDPKQIMLKDICVRIIQEKRT